MARECRLIIVRNSPKDARNKTKSPLEAKKIN